MFAWFWWFGGGGFCCFEVFFVVAEGGRYRSGIHHFKYDYKPFLLGNFSVFHLLEKLPSELLFFAFELHQEYLFSQADLLQCLPGRIEERGFK